MSRGCRLAGAALLGALALAPRAHAQVSAEAVVGPGLERLRAEDSRAGLLVRPSLRLDTPAVRLDARGRVAGGVDSELAGEALLAAAWIPGDVGLRPELGFDARASAAPRDELRRRAAARAGLRWSAGRAEAWAAALGGAASHDSEWRGLLGGDAGARVRTSWGGLRLQVSGAGFQDRVTVLDTTLLPPDTAVVRQRVQVPRSRRYTDAELGLSWRGGPLELEAALGTRFGSGGIASTSWGAVEAAWALTAGREIVAAYGIDPGTPEMGTRSTPVGIVGLRLSARPPRAPGVADDPGGSPAFTVLPAGPGTSLLRLTLGEARAVELKGDFTDWQPVSLRAAGAGAWEGAFALDPGLHRVNVRTDGGPWTVPPGLAAADDEFGGQVGIFVVE